MLFTVFITVSKTYFLPGVGNIRVCSGGLKISQLVKIWSVTLDKRRIQCDSGKCRLYREQFVYLFVVCAILRSEFLE